MHHHFLQILATYKLGLENLNSEWSKEWEILILFKQGKIALNLDHNLIHKSIKLIGSLCIYIEKTVNKSTCCWKCSQSNISLKQKPLQYAKTPGMKELQCNLTLKKRTF